MSDFYRNLSIGATVFIQETSRYLKGTVTNINKRYIEVQLFNTEGFNCGVIKFKFNGLPYNSSSSKYLSQLTEDDFKKIVKEKELKEKVEFATLSIIQALEKFQYSKNTSEKKLEVLESIDKYIKSLELKT